ncbi:MAG: hypothetical protein NTU63_00510 [Candidatus Pacearchaeota archaeon]|nr:hypothetical protein [Candidatus Pacearchaeota archaeon]
MTGKIEKIVAHGVEVFADVEMDNLRRERCLCLNCQKMPSNCSVSKDFYHLCLQNNIALMVTRCPEYVYK